MNLGTLDSAFDTGRFVDYVEKLHKNRDKGFEEQFKVNETHRYYHIGQCRPSGQNIVD